MTTTSAAEKLCGAPEIEEEKREKQEQNKSCVLKEMSVLKENNSNQEEELDMSECISEKIEEHSDLLKQTMHAVGQNDHEENEGDLKTKVDLLQLTLLRVRCETEAEMRRLAR